MEQPVVLTASDFESLGHAADHAELARGVLVRVNPPSYEHGRVAGLITAVLLEWIRPRSLGTVVVEAGFILEGSPDTVRAPDVAFIRNGRTGFPPTRGFARGAPDLAVEIASPDETPDSLATKAAEYLAAGGAVVWVIDPAGDAAMEYRPNGDVRTVPPGGALSGDPALPGLLIALRDLR